MKKSEQLTRAQLEALPAKKRMDALVDADDARAAVRRAPIQLLYQTIAEVGLADATALVQLASPEQYRALVDLGAWEGDRLDLHDALTWLRAARGDEPEEFFLKLHALDLEVVELVLRGLTEIHDRDENPDADPQGVVVETPDNKYLIELKVDGVELAALRQLVNDFIAADPFQSSRLFEALRWEVPSEMEEVAYRFRISRLHDLGFPPPEEAASIYAWVDPEPLRPPAPAAGLLKVPEGRVDYLGASLQALPANEAAVLEEEVRLLVNAALVADSADPGDASELRRIAEQTRDYLSLGFEHLTGADASQAVAVVQRHSPKRIFQVGFSLSLDLKRRADRLAKVIFTIEGAPPLLLFERVSFAALRRKRPMRALKVQGAEPVSFRSRAELEAAVGLLGRIEQQAQVFQALIEGAPDSLKSFGVPFHGLGGDRLFAAVVANAALDGRLQVGPLPAARLNELGGRLFEGDAAAPRLRSAAVDRAVSAIEPKLPEPLRPEVRRMIDATLARLLQELGSAFLREGALDAKSASSVIGIRTEP